jgi:hypothetical protein
MATGRCVSSKEISDTSVSKENPEIIRMQLAPQVLENHGIVEILQIQRKG